MCALKNTERSQSRSEGGFTILETAIALCVMLVVGIGVISLFLFSMGYNSGASNRARALAIAQERMEALRSTTYDNLTTMAADKTFNGSVIDGSKVVGESDAHTFNVATTVEDDPNIGNAKQKRITVTVTPANSRAWAGNVTLRMSRSQNTLGAN